MPPYSHVVALAACPFAPYPVYQVVFIVFAVYIASNAALPDVVFNTFSLQPGLLAGITVGVVANVGKIDIRKRKQIVPICFRLLTKLSVCVCVCVCVCV